MLAYSEYLQIEKTLSNLPEEGYAIRYLVFGETSLRDDNLL